MKGITSLQAKKGGDGFKMLRREELINTKKISIKRRMK